MANERTPLLRGHTTALTTQARPQRYSNFQLLLLCIARAVETASFNVMAPIVPDMVSKIGIREEDLGFYCGLVLSSHAVAQTVGMMFWSKWSDSKGRKPILVWCLIGAALSIAAFGYARTVWEMILIRCVMGVFSASELTVRVMLAEMTDNDPKAYAWLAVVLNIAQTLLPATTGILYQAARTNWQQPAVLPCLVTAALIAAVALVVHSFVDETRKSNGSNDGSNAEQMSFREVWQTPHIGSFAATWLLANGLNATWGAVIPVSAYTAVQFGGWSMSPGRVALYLAAAAGVSVPWAALIYPPLLRRLGRAKTLIWASAPTAPFFAWYAGSNILLRAGYDLAFWISLPLVLAFHPIVFATVQITQQVVLNDLVPANGLGAINSIMWSLNSALRAVLPGAANSFFAISVNRQILEGQLVFVVLAAMGLLHAVIMRVGAPAFASEVRQGKHGTEAGSVLEP